MSWAPLFRLYGHLVSRREEKGRREKGRRLGKGRCFREEEEGNSRGGKEEERNPCLEQNKPPAAPLAIRSVRSEIDGRQCLKRSRYPCHWRPAKNAYCRLLGMSNICISFDKVTLPALQCIPPNKPPPAFHRFQAQTLSSAYPSSSVSPLSSSRSPEGRNPSTSYH